MKKLDPKIFLLTILVVTIICSSDAFACSCGSGGPSMTIDQVVNGAVKGSTSVFRGKVVGFEYRKGIRNEYMESRRASTGQPIEYETRVVKFEVYRWWKLQLPPITFIVTNSTKDSDGMSSMSTCDYTFSVGEKYLVYAYGKADALEASLCTRTSTIARASEDLEILGEGFRPIEPPTVRVP